MAIYPTAAATDGDLYVAVNNKFTTLNGAIDAVTTTIVLTSASGFPTAGYVSIDTEAIKYTGIAVNTLTGVTRGADGTTAASHADASLVEHRGIAAHHNAPKDEIIAIETDLGSRIAFGTDRLRGVSGSAASPTYSFASDTDTGLLLGGTNTLAISTGGTTRFTFDTTSLSLPDGSVSSPALTFLNDPNTGIFWPASDQLNVSLGGTTKINFASTTTLTGPLTVNDATALAIRVQGTANGTNPRIIAVNTNTTAGQNRNGLIGCAGDNFNVELSLIAGKDSSDVNVEMLSGTTKLQFAIGGIEYGRQTTTQFLNQNGSSGAPTFSFISDPDTGMFRAGANSLALGVGGTAQIVIESGMLRAVSDGTAASPVYTFHNDTDTGIYRAGGNTVAIATGGVQRFTFDTTTLGAPDGSVTSPAYSFTGDFNTGIYRFGTDAVRGAAGGVDAIGYDNSTTSGQTRFLVYDVDNATVERVTVGAADSGGVGFKVLRIPN